MVAVTFQSDFLRVDGKRPRMSIGHDSSPGKFLLVYERPDDYWTDDIPESCTVTMSRKMRREDE